MSLKNILDYVERHKGNYEIGKFAGDIFWYNNLFFASLALALDTVFLAIFKKQEPRNHWTVIDLKSLGDKAATKLYPDISNMGGGIVPVATLPVKNEFNSIILITDLMATGSISVPIKDHPYSLYPIIG